MTQEHPITPPDYLVKEWSSMYWQQGSQATFTDAARWGADQELEACCKWLKTIAMTKPWDTVAQLALELRTSRRPQPPSLKAQALALINHDPENQPFLSENGIAIIRRALESLPD